MRRFLTPRWLLWHLAVLIMVAVCLALGWCQLSRARGGNALSIGYTVEWPVFALFVIGIWVREMRLQLRAGRPPEPPAPSEPADPLSIAVPVPQRAAPELPEDAELVRYNRYLEWLNAHPDRKPADYPGQ